MTESDQMERTILTGKLHPQVCSNDIIARVAIVVVLTPSFHLIDFPALPWVRHDNALASDSLYGVAMKGGPASSFVMLLW